MSSPAIPRKLTKTEAIAKLWDMGNLTYKMHSAQVDMYKRIQEGDDIIRVIACSRGWGKSFALLTIAFETCLNKPNAIVKYAAPTAKDLKSIVMDNYKKVMEDCPKKYADKIKWKVQENKIVFEHNGSEIHLAGVEKGNFEKLRGATADLCIIDEAGFCDKLDYIVKSVMFPMIARGKGDIRAKRIVMASTPSKSNDHDFISYMRDYEFKEKLVKYTIHENPLMEFQAKNSGFATTQAFIDTVILAPYPDGVEATAYKREFLCEIFTEDDDAVVPEFSKKEVQELSIREWVNPSHYDIYVSMDIGFSDLTVALFGYYDFQNAKLVIKDELVLSGTKMLTDNLALEIKMKESANFYNKYTGEGLKPYLRIADNNNPILLQDLSIKHDLHFSPTNKDNKDAALNNMRMMLKSGRIIIDPKCKVLISHLKGAVWNSARTSYARGSDKSHYDAVDSLCYMCRNVDFNRNPFPNNSYSPTNHFITISSVNNAETPTEKAIMGMKLGVKRRR
jgi:Terminase large subunit, T4likevirus-type, N-terminal